MKKWSSHWYITLTDIQVVKRYERKKLSSPLIHNTHWHTHHIDRQGVKQYEHPHWYITLPHWYITLTDVQGVQRNEQKNEHPHWYITLTDHPHWYITLTDHPHWCITLTDHPHWYITLTGHPHWYITLTDIQGVKRYEERKKKYHPHRYITLTGIQGVKTIWGKKWTSPLIRCTHTHTGSLTIWAKKGSSPSIQLNDTPTGDLNTMKRGEKNKHHPHQSITLTDLHTDCSLSDKHKGLTLKDLALKQKPIFTGFQVRSWAGRWPSS